MRFVKDVRGGQSNIVLFVSDNLKNEQKRGWGKEIAMMKDELVELKLWVNPKNIATAPKTLRRWSKRRLTPSQDLTCLRPKLKVTRIRSHSNLTLTKKSTNLCLKFT